MPTHQNSFFDYGGSNEYEIEFEPAQPIAYNQVSIAPQKSLYVPQDSFISDSLANHAMSTMQIYQNTNPCPQIRPP